jgi:hypothetical protein
VLALAAKRAMERFLGFAAVDLAHLRTPIKKLSQSLEIVRASGRAFSSSPLKAYAVTAMIGIEHNDGSEYHRSVRTQPKLGGTLAHCAMRGADNGQAPIKNYSPLISIKGYCSRRCIAHLCLRGPFGRSWRPSPNLKWLRFLAAAVLSGARPARIRRRRHVSSAEKLLIAR